MNNSTLSQDISFLPGHIFPGRLCFEGRIEFFQDMVFPGRLCFEGRTYFFQDMFFPGRLCFEGRCIAASGAQAPTLNVLGRTPGAAGGHQRKEPEDAHLQQVDERHREVRKEGQAQGYVERALH